MFSFVIHLYMVYRALHNLFLLTLTALSSVHLLSRVQLFATPGTAAHQASLSITNSQSCAKTQP